MESAACCALQLFAICLAVLTPRQSSGRQVPETKKPTFGLVTEMGCQRFTLSISYRAIPPHCGALLQLQQMQAPSLILGHTRQFLSYSGTRESQFAAC